METEKFMLNYSAGAVKAINQKVNELLLKYENPSKDTVINPSVDIMKIAQACKVKKVMRVSSEQLNGKHADVKNGIVRIDENDTEGQYNFDLAHEVGHIVFNHITKSIEYKVTQPGENGKPESSFIITTTEYKAARQGTTKKSELSPEEREIEDFFDRFAANLLVPINRFQLWEDRPDKEIAEAFKVEEKCIAKRRHEVAHEINILTREMKPCSIETINDPDVKLDIEAILKEVNSNNADR